jgi:hypothetical protein
MNLNDGAMSIEEELRMNKINFKYIEMMLK